LAKVAIEGWKQPGYACAEALASLNQRARGRSVLLSPFDSLIWYRDRVERLFDFRHRLEAYVPKAKRQFGYFAMPVLGGTKLVGLVDPGRREDVFVAKHVTLLEPTALASVARAIVEAASWVGCTQFLVERVSPAAAGADLKRALRSNGAAEVV
jgi:uncharacterized protein YcaQ